mmetsp:Transcript_10337/g.10406  ORF Transcript_10337/g.10406 Transcript_10337/m.10406 type:complete len:444 (+) Transcript_10337:140-1471(+)
MGKGSGSKESIISADTSHLASYHTISYSYDDIRDNDIIREKVTNPYSFRNLVLTVLAFLSVFCATFILQINIFPMGLLYVRDLSLSGSRKVIPVYPGEPMTTESELWPCEPDPEIEKGTCDRSSRNTYSNIYTDPGYPTTNKPPYKMVFYKNRVKLYAKSRSVSDCAWSLSFSLIKSGYFKCNDKTVTIQSWGKPYWIMSQQFNYQPKKLSRKKVIEMKYGISKKKNVYSIKFKSRKLTRKFKIKEKTRGTIRFSTVIPNCEKVAFVLKNDGNLVLVAMNETNKVCDTLYQSGDFLSLQSSNKLTTESALSSSLLVSAIEAVNISLSEQSSKNMSSNSVNLEAIEDTKKGDEKYSMSVSAGLRQEIPTQMKTESQSQYFDESSTSSRSSELTLNSPKDAIQNDIISSVAAIESTEEDDVEYEPDGEDNNNDYNYDDYQLKNGD